MHRRILSPGPSFLAPGFFFLRRPNVAFPAAEALETQRVRSEEMVVPMPGVCEICVFCKESPLSGRISWESPRRALRK